MMGRVMMLGMDLRKPPSHPLQSQPTAMLLLGSGLIGLAGYGRKKFFKK